MAEKRTKEELQVEAKKHLLDETDVKKNACPWCNYENQDEEKGPVHTKVKGEYLVRNATGKFQCDSCGKLWDKAALGKEWSYSLERGPGWVHAMRLRGLTEGKTI